jgi:glucosylceramidase
MMGNKIVITAIILAGMLSIHSNCSKSKKTVEDPPPPPPPVTNGITAWITRGDQSVLLQKQANQLGFSVASNTNTTIEVDSTQTFQTIDGFGYTLTGGSAYLINRLPVAQKSSLLQELFGNSESSISVSYLRVSIGASDLSTAVFSYNDLPAGQTDLTLSQFSLALDTVDLVPLLKEILLINPGIKILGSPWSAPVWMKDNGNAKGGKLRPQYYNVYAQYFVKYIQQMKARGITIDAITPQNEPENGGNNPSMVMTAADQTDFIKNHLGPAFQAAALSTKIIIFDHNCDNPGYPNTILNDAAAKPFINGSAFHLYAGDISALSVVHNAHPDKQIYFTEQYTGANGSFDGDLKWHLKNVIIGSMRNWSRIALEWNLANDGAYNPRTPGGCSECKGAITLDGAINRNVSYYIVAHVSRFVPPGSVRIASTLSGNIYTVAFQTPTGKKVLVVLNDGGSAAAFNIKFNGKIAVATLPGGAVGTFVW